MIFRRITLHSADPRVPLVVYPSVGEHVGFVAITQVSPMGEERPVAFLSRYLTATEQKWGELEQVVSLVSWGLRKARRYTTLTPHVCVKLPQAADVACVLDQGAHLRLQALLVDLTLYRVKWEIGRNKWRWGEEVAAGQVLHEEDQVDVPIMKHKHVVIKR